jgi:hypothetical protein
MPDITNQRRVSSRASSLPLRARMAVDTVDGALDLYEADTRIFLDVTEEDIARGVCDDPKHCVAANSATRMYGAIAVDFHRTVAYIIWPAGKGPYKTLRKEYAVRYVMPAETMRQVAVFDGGGEIVPSQLDFHAVTAGRTLEYRREAVRKSLAKKAGRTIQSKNTAGPRGGHRYITGFIGTRVD